jgi:hypothetical protein
MYAGDCYTAPGITERERQKREAKERGKREGQKRERENFIPNSATVATLSPSRKDKKNSFNLSQNLIHFLLRLNKTRFLFLGCFMCT